MNFTEKAWNKRNLQRQFTMSDIAEEGEKIIKGFFVE